MLASILVALGTFDTIVAYFIFITVVFIALTVAAVFVLARRDPGVQVPGHPWTAACFWLMVAGLLVTARAEQPVTGAARRRRSSRSALPVYRLTGGVRRLARCATEVFAMTWIRNDSLRRRRDGCARRAQAQQALYPIEYAQPTHPHHKDTDGIVGSHSLIPDALHHAFAASAR